MRVDCDDIFFHSLKFMRVTKNIRYRKKNVSNRFKFCKPHSSKTWQIMFGTMVAKKAGVQTISEIASASEIDFLFFYFFLSLRTI